MDDSLLARVKFDLDLMPEPPKQPRLLHLAPPEPVAEGLLSESIGHLLEFKSGWMELGSSGARGVRDAGGRLLGFRNPKDGSTHVFPLLRADPAAGASLELMAGKAAAFFDAAKLAPGDGTTALAQRPLGLFAAQHPRVGDPAMSGVQLVYQRYRRMVDDLPVFGPGTRASVAVGPNGEVSALAHRWQAVQSLEDGPKPLPHPAIQKVVIEQLATSAKNADVEVDSVRLAYHDAGTGLLQPVYRVGATVRTRPTDGAKAPVADRHVLVYVPIGDTPAPLRILGQPAAVRPTSPNGPFHKQTPHIPMDDPTVGRYVVRNDTDEWVSSANEFWDGLQLAQGLFGSPISFTDSQYYWAEPRLFEADKDAFINSVQLALNEVHGNWWLFSTRDNSDDMVNLGSIPAPGFGGSGGGALAYWMIHSCEVVPTIADETTSFDVWWTIFNGLHAVMGYRTEMWIDDDVMGDIGFAVGLGAPAVPAWLQTIATSDSYDDGDTYFDGNVGMREPMGRASAVVVCGHDNDIVSDTSNLGPADCLTEWWFDN